MNLSWRRGGIVCALAVLALSWPASLRGEDRRLRDLDKALAEIEARLGGPAAAIPAAAASPERAPALAEMIADLDQRDRARRREFAAVRARRLTGTVGQRLERARAAYEAGHGRLLAILRELAAPAGTSAASVPAAHLALAGEAREILARMARASEAEPISSGDLSVRAPRL